MKHSVMPLVVCLGLFAALNLAHAQSQSASNNDSRSVWDRLKGKTKALAASEAVARGGMGSVFAGQTKTVMDDRNWPVVKVEILRDGKARFTPYNTKQAGTPVDVAAAADGSYTWEAGKGSNDQVLIDGVIVKGKGGAGSGCAPVKVRAAAGNIANDKGQTVFGWSVTATVQVARGGGENPCSELLPHEFTAK